MKKTRAAARWSMAAVIAAVMLLVAARILLRDTPEVPDPDTSAMEPQVAEAIAAARLAVLDVPASESWSRLAMVLHAHGLGDEAAACYEEASDRDRESFRWPYLLANALKAKDPQRALDGARRAADLKPDFAPAHMLIGLLYEQLAEDDRARRAYTRALRIDRSGLAAELALGRLGLKRGSSIPAGDTWSASPRTSPEPPWSTGFSPASTAFAETPKPPGVSAPAPARSRSRSTIRSPRE